MTEYVRQKGEQKIEQTSWQDPVEEDKKYMELPVLKTKQFKAEF